MGFPWLATDLPHEFPRVQAANDLYHFMADCIPMLRARGISWSIENPANSLLWQIPAIKKITEADAGEYK